MILDENLQALRRVWCLFEVDCVFRLGKRFDLINDLGPLQAVIEESLGSATQLRQLEDGLAGILARHAESSIDTDKLAIWHQICAPSLQKLPLNLIMEFKSFDGASDFTSFDFRVRSLLATPPFSS
eukprot:TRINITY_DN60013_c0_g1_i1.p3 TRINITY_DN60013_c0_g1~~TRINITY_DN60013_c0_g1_i1.p3  ORF type:complete len:126 (-),score=21.75 TRINITY_DN60013_c0_g1_i1:979-1356(-)